MWPKTPVKIAQSGPGDTESAGPDRRQLAGACGQPACSLQAPVAREMSHLPSCSQGLQGSPGNGETVTQYFGEVEIGE